MSETRFTPGPWRVVVVDYSRGEDASIEVVHGRGEVVAQTITRELATESDRFDGDKANAHLIAAAPYLYAALEKIANEMQSASSRGRRVSVEWLDLRIETARAALRKARGEA